MGRSGVCTASCSVPPRWTAPARAALADLEPPQYLFLNSNFPRVRFLNSFGKTASDASHAALRSPPSCWHQTPRVAPPGLTHHFGVPRVAAAWVPRPDHHSDVSRVKLLTSSGASWCHLPLPMRWAMLQPGLATLPGLVPPARSNICWDQPAKAKACREQVAISSGSKGKSPLLRQCCWHACGDQGGNAAEQFSYL